MTLSIKSMEAEQATAEFAKRPEEVRIAHSDKIESTKKELDMAGDALTMLKGLQK